ncbi:hypothetical protein HPP92_027546 [Vanilla planifolia]|uniref:Protein kinase domain-containing protein n=1 Tax=Vanilla planifolia TaxID=51239 RepID=A0A835PC33_VANPL|nr:hypothetical protein HPP92_027546 [Vanilla planifolia]
MANKKLLSLAFSLLLSFTSAFSPIFLNCGSSISTTISSDNPSRTFTPDEGYLLSPSNSKIASDSSSSSLPSIYSTARIFDSPSSYRFEVDPNAFYILRLHFLAFPSTSAALFNVSALDRYLLLSSTSLSFSSPSIKEFLLWVDTSPLHLTFSPAPNSNSQQIALINALELISSPANILKNIQPTYITENQNFPLDNFVPKAMETVYRINVGGPRITPVNDTLWRTWEPDDSFVFNLALSLNNFTSTQQIKYPTENGLNSTVAPEMVYSTARTLDTTAIADGMANVNFNLTWSFNASPNFQYFIRMHFCNNWFPSLPTFFFEVYLNGFSAKKDLNPGRQTNWNMMVPFYLDFVVDSPSSGGPLNVSIGPASNSNPINAMLNGLEIMKLNNSFLSLVGPFGLVQTDNNNHGKSHLVLILIPSVLGGLLLFLLFLVLGTYRRRKQPKSPKEQKETTPESWTQYNIEPKTDVSVLRASSNFTNPDSPRLKLGLHISFTDIAFATSNFDEKLVIGSGGFGKVYKGVLRDGTKVAIKRSMPGNRQGYPEFQTEIVVLSRIRHRHLVSLIGYCEEQSEMILVYEYMEKEAGGLYRRGKGLQYLHTAYAQSIIHRDVKSTNILLDENFAAKVSDFGLSRLGPSLGETHVSTAVKGTFGYLDPEYFKIQKLTDKSDIYSFGVVLFEVLCARPAIDDYVNLAELALNCQRQGQLEKIIDPKLVGKINENSLRKFAETAAKCLADYGVDRPSIGNVLWNLEYALQLQETQLRREPFEDSGTVDVSEIAVATVRRSPSSSRLKIEVEEDEGIAGTTREFSEMTTRMVFSQLVTGDGR